MTGTTQVLDDLHYVMQQAVTAAIAVATGRLDLDDPAITTAKVREGHGPAIEYVRHEIARQVAGMLVREDDNVLAVYEEHVLPEAEEMSPPPPSLADPINIVVYSQLETAAMRSMIDGIDRALVEALTEQWGEVSPGIISVEVIDAERSKRLNLRANGFRPHPTLLVAREA